MSWFEKEFSRLTDSQKNRRRNLVWYRRWFEVISMLKKSGVKDRNVVERLHDFLNHGGYGKAHIAYSGRLSMRLAIEDCLENDCNECNHRFRCFTER